MISEQANGKQSYHHTMTINQILSSFPQLPKDWVLRAKVTRKPDKINHHKPFMVIRLVDNNKKSIEAIFFGEQASLYCNTLQHDQEYLFSKGIIKMKKNQPQQFQIKFNQHSKIVPINQRIPTPSRKTQILDGIDVVGKVIKIKRITKGRSLQLLTNQKEYMEVVLWEEFNDELQEQQTYQFSSLKMKYFNGIPSLQSIRNKTQIKVSPLKVQSQSLKPSIQLKTLSQIAEFTEERSFTYVSGYILLSNFPDPHRYFKIQCPECGSKESFHSPKISCKHCMKQPNIRWNIRAQFMDQCMEVKCILNQSFCEAKFGLTSKQGYKLFGESIDAFMRRMEDVCSVEKVYKVKANPYNGNMFYNILQECREDSTLVLRKELKELKKVMREYVNCK